MDLCIAIFEKFQLNFYLKGENKIFNFVSDFSRVFSKVKSRSAHMKSHRMAENEKNKMKQNNNVEISLNSIQGSVFR